MDYDLVANPQILDVNNTVPMVQNTGMTMRMEDWLFVGVLMVILLIILLSNRPMVGPALDSMADDAYNNPVSDFVMSGISSSYALHKNHKKLNDVLKEIRSPLQTSNTLMELKQSIDVDLDEIMDREIHNDLIRSASKDAIKGGKRLRPIIAYSIVNHMRRASNGNTLQSYDIRNLNAIELLHAASLIVDDIMDQDDMRRGKPAIHIAYETNIALMTAAQLTVTAFKMIGRIDHQSKEHSLDKLCEKRIRSRQQTMRTEHTRDPDDLESDGYALVNSALYDTSELIDGQVMDIYGSNDTKELVLDSIRKKTASIYAMIFEMAWVIGGGPIDREAVSMVRDAANDFGIMFQIYDDFTDYYSDQLSNEDNSNYALNIGLDEARDEFYSRTSDFMQKATNLGIMTNAIKHVLNYLSDSVVVSYRLIRDLSGKPPDTETDIDVDTDADTETDY